MALIHMETAYEPLRFLSPPSLCHLKPMDSLVCLQPFQMYMFIISLVICFYNPVRFNIVSFTAMFVLVQENRSLPTRLFFHVLFLFVLFWKIALLNLMPHCTLLLVC